MLPLDYADRGVARQRRNVGRLTGFTSLVIIGIGAFRLSQSLGLEGPMGLHLIEITLIFSMASNLAKIVFAFWFSLLFKVCPLKIFLSKLYY